MKQTRPLFLILTLSLLCSSFLIAQTKVDRAILKADRLLGEPDKKMEAFRAYQLAQKIAKKPSDVEEIAKGLHACAVSFYRDGLTLQKNNSANASVQFANAWDAYKAGELTLSKEKINPYATYAACVSAVNTGNSSEAQPYLENLKQTNYGKDMVYSLLVRSYLQTDLPMAKRLLTEGLSKYPKSNELKTFSSNF